MNISKHHFAFLTLSVLAIFVAIISWYVTSWLFEVMEKKEVEMYNRMAEIRHEEARFSSFDKMRQQVSEANDESVQWQNAVLNESDKIEYITFLESIAIENELTIVIETGQVSAGNFGETSSEEKEENIYGNDISTFDLRVTVEGSYENIRQFLLIVENAPMIVHVQNITISMEKKNERQNMINGSGMFFLESTSEGDGKQEDSSLATKDQLQAIFSLRSFVRNSESVE